MFILGGPYISQFLIDTLVTLQIPVIHNDVIDEYRLTKDLNLIPESEAIKIFASGPECLLYTNSENSISWIEKNLQHTSLPQKIKLFKNKFLFREMMQTSFHDYFYRRVLLDEMETLDVSSFPFPFILKPAVGFFSLGVYKVEHPGEWIATVHSVKHELEQIIDLYPPEVLYAEEFIVEHCIHGEEYAVDCYYNSDGRPVVLNIMKHIFPSQKDVNDRVYITSKDIIESCIDSITLFLADVGKLAGLTNFPAHVEVRFDSDGNIAPIEVNPLRFGGWCSTPDLAWYAFGINLYEYVYFQKQPDWPFLLAGKENLVYSNIVLNNSTGIEGKNILSFDYDKLLSDFENPLELRKADYKKFPLFGFLFCETHTDNWKEIEKILKSDLIEFASF